MLRISRWQIIFILAVIVLGIAFAAPNVVSEEDAQDAPSWLPHQQINLGLDLAGGSHLLLEVDLDKVVIDRLANLDRDIGDALFNAEPRIGFIGGITSTSEAVLFQLRDLDERDRAEEIIDGLADGLVIDIADDGAVRVSYTEEAIADIHALAMDQVLEVTRRRIDELGTREPNVQRQGDENIIVEVPGVGDPNELLDIIDEPGVLTFHLLNTQVSPNDPNPPRGTEIYPSAEEGGPNYALFRAERSVSGTNIVNAYPSFQENRWVVAFTFDGAGGRGFGNLTSAHVGDLLAIVLDGEVISAPEIQTGITGGSGIIRGAFTAESANNLAILLRAGALPADVNVLEVRSVGAGLGQDSIDAGTIACVIGLIAVMIFMGLAYGLFGVFADVALVVNLILIGAILSVLQATLTLPGIAGIVLTVGMAVDANVLVFERIREELANGRSVFNAVDSGYKRALTTIIDANVTTLIAAVILFNFGSGPIKGFAVTLSIGIITSVFTATMVTRLFVVSWLRRSRPAALQL